MDYILNDAKDIETKKGGVEMEKKKKSGRNTE